MGGLTVQIPSGAVAFYKTYNAMDCLLQYESEESQEAFNKFEYSAREACIGKATKFILENEMDAESFCVDNQLQLQACEFDVYVRSCMLIEFDSSLGQLLKDSVLDLKSFHALDQKKFAELLDIFPELPCNIYCKEKRYVQFQGKFVESLKLRIDELGELESIDEIYACRKSLANCEFIKGESEFDEIFNQLKYEEKWTNVSDDVLKIALQQHFSLLRALKSDTKGTNGIIPDKQTELLADGDIQKAVDCEYRKQRHELLARQLKRYHQHMEFKRLINQDVTKCDAYGVGYVPKSVIPGNQRTPRTLQAKPYELKNLCERKDAVKLQSGVEVSGRTKVLPPPHQLNHVHAKFMGGPKKGWPALANAVLGMGVGISGKIKKLWQL